MSNLQLKDTIALFSHLVCPQNIYLFVSIHELRISLIANLQKIEKDKIDRRRDLANDFIYFANLIRICEKFEIDVVEPKKFLLSFPFGKASLTKHRELRDYDLFERDHTSPHVAKIMINCDLLSIDANDFNRYIVGMHHRLSKFFELKEYDEDLGLDELLDISYKFNKVNDKLKMVHIGHMTIDFDFYHFRIHQDKFEDLLRREVRGGLWEEEIEDYKDKINKLEIECHLIFDLFKQGRKLSSSIYDTIIEVEDAEQNAYYHREMMEYNFNEDREEEERQEIISLHLAYIQEQRDLSDSDD